MSEQEKEQNRVASDDPDVEGHRRKAYNDEGPQGEEPERRETGEEPDVEAHRRKA
jgi:hypothetical protein